MIKEKKVIIFWTLFVTLVIVFSSYMYLTTDITKESILEGIFATIFASIMLLGIPFLIIYRIFIREINVKEFGLDWVFLVALWFFALTLGFSIIYDPILFIIDYLKESKLSRGVTTSILLTILFIWLIFFRSKNKSTEEA